MGEGDIIRFNSDKVRDDRPSTHTSEPETARDAQRLERLCRSGGKHLKPSSKELQTLQIESRNTLSLENKQEELQTFTCLQGSDLICITELHGVPESKDTRSLGGTGMRRL